MAAPQDEAPFVEYIRALLSGLKIDLIVPVGAPAAYFIQRHRVLLFPDTPMLIIGADQQRVPNSTFATNDTAVLFDIDDSIFVENILHVLPQTTSIAIVSGSAPTDRFWASALHQKVEQLANQVNFIWFNDLTFTEMLTRAAAMPPRSAILWYIFSEDAAGIPQLEERALPAMREVSSVPVFGTRDYQLGRGIVGGRLTQTQLLGEEAATVALRILNGEKARDINAPRVQVGAPTYDWRELRRWGISEALLPAGSIVQFREPTVWQQYRWSIMLVAATLAAQTSLVVYVLFQSRRRRAAELSFKESEERMTFTAASANVGLWQFDRTTNQLWATEHCRALFGLGKDVSLVRDTLLTAIHPEDRDTVAAWFRGATNLRYSPTADFRVTLANDQVRWLRVRARSNPGDRTAPDRLSGIFIDVTDQKTAKAEAAQQRQELAHLMRVSVLGELSGAMAHELNQPLTAILSNAQAALNLLAEKSPDLSEVREAIHDIVAEDNRAGDIIERLRNLLRKGERKIELVDINELVQSTVALLKSELIGRHIEVETRFASGLPEILGDPVQLQQVLLNIVMNAMDAMASTPGALRRITASTQAGQAGIIEVLVRDRGSGIKKEVEDQLFSPFYTSKPHGLGLGLTICSTIAEAHGGKLTLRNHDERGAIAVFSLPVTSAAGE